MEHYISSAAVAGVCLHLFYFQRGEHHLNGIWYLQIFISAFGALTAVLTFGYNVASKSALGTSSSVFGALLLGLHGSLMCYRLIWHPLRKFPGPFGAKISNLWLSTQVTNFDNHKKALELYGKYGPFVRVGSSDLMIVHPQGVPAVHGAQSKCTKASWYDGDFPRQSVHTCRDPQFHQDRRRVWSQSFSDKALREYKKRISLYNIALMDRLAESRGQPLNAAKWFNYYSFDVMGDLAFGRDFGMLKSGQQHWAITLLEDSMSIQGLKLPTWIFRIMIAIPGLTDKYWKFLRYCDEQLDAKMADLEKNGESDTPELMATLVAHAHRNPHRDQALTMLRSDSRIVIVAGSDTTASTLSFIFYQLACHPQHQELLRRELAPLVGADGTFDHQNIADADHLNAVISESLRLNPVPPTAILRKTPEEGIVVDGTFVPGGMDVWTPMYVIGRSEMAYEKPYAFVPERWYSRPEMVRQKVAYAPFLIGPYSCIGRPLAQMQLRTVVAEAVMKFDIAFAAGKDGSEFIDKVKDRFTWGLADLDLCFQSRA